MSGAGRVKKRLLRNEQNFYSFPKLKKELSEHAVLN